MGKTDLSIGIAKAFGTEIISCDSRQIYKEMRIGTAVPSPGQLAAVRHHFIQMISVHDYYNSWQFEVQALERIRELFQEKEVVLMTGGSMLYIDAVCKGIDDIPTISPELRTGLMEVYEREGLESIRQMLKELEIFNQQQDFCAYTIEMYGRQSFVVLFYHMGNEHETYQYLEQTIVPMICNTVRGRVVCTWAVSNGFGNMYEAVRELDHAAEWNLILKKGTLICKEKIQKIALYPYKYPVNLEKEAKEALLNKDAKRLKKIFSRYWDYCRELPCTPQEAKEGCIRIALVLIQMAAETGAVQAQRKGQTFLQRISRANGWTDVEEKVDTFFEYLTSKDEAGNDMSLLVQKALENIREYYDQGITLEEIAEKLHVTEEYLSTQFRKETGRTFTETIRGYRIERIKELLTATNWKLTKIAELAGYTDPKYMSRVFKEETGMLPLEYRKKNC